MCILIAQQVCFHRSTEMTFTSNMIGCLQGVRGYIFMKKVKLYLCALGFCWSALEFSQMFASIFTRRWRHRENVLFLKCLSLSKSSWKYRLYSYIAVTELEYDNRLLWKECGYAIGLLIRIATLLQINSDYLYNTYKSYVFCKLFLVCSVQQKHISWNSDVLKKKWSKNIE